MFTYFHICYELFFITDKVKTITTITIIRTTTNAKVKPMAINKNIGPKNHPTIQILEIIINNNHAYIIIANATAKNRRAARIRI